MSASTIADILQDARAFAAACEELAEHLEATVAQMKTPGLLESQQTAFLRVLPLMCAFASLDEQTAFAARLRGLAARLDALPASADELARVLSAPADEFAKFEALLFEDDPSRQRDRSALVGDDDHSRQRECSASARQGELFEDGIPRKSGEGSTNRTRAIDGFEDGIPRKSGEGSTRVDLQRKGGEA